MILNSLLPFLASAFSVALAFAIVFRRRRSVAGWCFCAGMLVFAFESVVTGISILATLPEKLARWQTVAFSAKSFLPGIWLCFSLTYSRANYREFLARSRLLLIAAFLLPLCFLAAFNGPFLYVVSYEPPVEGWGLKFSEAAKVLNAFVLIFTVLILMNLERTFRSAVGTMRWQIKFLVLGLGVIFGTRIYTRSQALLFSGCSLGQLNIEAAALLIGCTLIAVGYWRNGLGEIDLYPSRAALHTSVTLLLAGAYLFVVGILAQIVARFGGANTFPFEAFLVLVGISVLAVLFLSNRMRQSIQLFISRHFRRPQHDFRKVWTRFTQRMSVLLDEKTLCATASRLISETFNALSVSIWLIDDQRASLIRASSTADLEDADNHSLGTVDERGSLEMAKIVRPFDLETATGRWAATLRSLMVQRFRTGGNRICVPLIAGERQLGVIILADRVAGRRYTGEEMDLLQCIGDQLAGSLLNIHLTKELMARKEMQAFQTMSAFFVHDLKNAASTLDLMLQNLPVHFDDPAFRQDALQGIGSAAHRINDIIGRLSALQHELRLKRTDIDLNQLVTQTLKLLDGTLEAEVVTHLPPLPPIFADPEKIESVVTNLLLNARDAVSEKGRIAVETSRWNDRVVLSVADNGCGMTSEFIQSSLFRPFRTTKKKGLGIGMFQVKMIIDAHDGTIQVKSEPGAGTTFRVILPAKLEAQ